MSTTPTLGLKRWVGTDRVARAEIVDNFDKIDDATTDIYANIQEMRRLITRLDTGWSVIDEINFRYPDNNGVFYDMLDGQGARVTATSETAQTYTTAAVSVGATALPVGNSADFAVGEEITIYDDVNSEDVKITAIAAGQLTVTALTKAYKAKATVARTTAVTDAVNTELTFPTWGTSAITITEA